MERNTKQRNMQGLIEEIRELKRKKKAVILVHNYQLPEIDEVADFIGDSFELAREAAKTDAKVIVFCGVDFMAESAAILNPYKEVFLPALDAKCPMAAMVDVEGLEKLKSEHPEAAVVCYINTSAEIKAASDICCTSSNVVKVVNSLPNKKVIFVPDKNLAAYVASRTDKEIIPWNGFCYVHHGFKLEEVKRAKEISPKAKIIAHPECPPEIIELAHHVCSTSQMIRVAKKSKAREFIVLTELGMAYRLKGEAPDKNFYPIPERVCAQMKKNSLELVRKSLFWGQHRVTVPEDISIGAKKALDRMLELSC